MCNYFMGTLVLLIPVVAWGFVGGPISSSTHANKDMDVTTIRTAMLIFVFIFFYCLSLRDKGSTIL